MAPLIRQASDHSLLVLFGDSISPEHHQNVRKLTHLLLSNLPPFIRNVHPAYSSVLVSFDPVRISSPDIESRLRSLLDHIDSLSLPEGRLKEIPLVYGDEFGPDLLDVALHNGLDVDDVIRLHESGHYLVYFLGFSPGFPYLGGLSERIATPRLSTPRTIVPAGSVAIAGNQTGIYPVSSPGGWRIIGRTPLRLFDPQASPPTLLEMGDRVRFKRISRSDFDELDML